MEIKQIEIQDFKVIKCTWRECNQTITFDDLIGKHSGWKHILIESGSFLESDSVLEADVDRCLCPYHFEKLQNLLLVSEYHFKKLRNLLLVSKLKDIPLKDNNATIH